MQAGPNLCKFSQITRFDVVDTNGQSVGSLDDLVFDPDSGQIRYAIVKAGGVLGIGGKNLAVPFGAMEIRGNQIQVNRTKNELMNAPWFEPQQALNREYERTAYSYWQQPFYWEETRH